MNKCESFCPTADRRPWLRLFTPMTPLAQITLIRQRYVTGGTPQVELSSSQNRRICRSTSAIVEDSAMLLEAGFARGLSVVPPELQQVQTQHVSLGWAASTGLCRAAASSQLLPLPVELQSTGGRLLCRSWGCRAPATCAMQLKNSRLGSSTAATQSSARPQPPHRTPHHTQRLELPPAPLSYERMQPRLAHTRRPATSRCTRSLLCAQCHRCDSAAAVFHGCMGGGSSATHSVWQAVVQAPEEQVPLQRDQLMLLTRPYCSISCARPRSVQLAIEKI